MESSSKKLPLRESLQQYWKHLVGLTALPPVLTVGEAAGVPFGILLIPFFAFGLAALWPYLFGRAPFSFWGVALVLWLASGALTAIIAVAIRAIAV